MLSIKGLNVQYGKRKILDNIELEFKKGSITVIKGLSGSGKSSLLNILGLLQNPNPGCEYILDGEKINFSDDRQKSLLRLNKIGFVFQQNNLLSDFTAIENIRIPLRLISNDKEFIEKRSNDLVNYVGISEVALNYISELSGGEEQRTAIARALANNADIILADEPTASLDEDNSKLILDLFKKMAHELNKTVIIVSHDPKVSDIGDKVFEISNLKLNLRYNNDKNFNLEQENNKNVKNKNLRSFINHYIKKRKKSRLFSGVLITITSIVAAIATLFLNFGDSFTQQQKDFVNAISENNILVINEVSKGKSKIYHDDNIPFSSDQLKSIESIKNIKKAYSFFTFASSGTTYENERQEQSNIIIMGDNGEKIKAINYENPMSTYSSSNTSFNIEPLYAEQNIQHILDFATDNYRDGMILTTEMAKTLSENPENLIGKKISIHCLVPTKLYKSHAKGKISDQNGTVEYECELNPPIYTFIDIESRVTGILSSSYDVKRCPSGLNFMLMDYEQMNKILEKNIDHDIGETFPGFPEKEWGPSALMVFADNFNNINQIKSDLKDISSDFVVVDKAADVKAIENNLNMIKKVMISIDTILIIIVILLFGFLYYLKNKTRKKEIGILKSIGMTKADIFKMIIWETFIIAIKTFIFSSALSFVLSMLGNNLFRANLFLVSVQSIIFCFLLSFITIIFSSIFSIYKTSKIDPIDAIRLNK